MSVKTKVTRPCGHGASLLLLFLNEAPPAQPENIPELWGGVVGPAGRVPARLLGRETGRGPDDENGVGADEAPTPASASLLC